MIRLKSATILRDENPRFQITVLPKRNFCISTFLPTEENVCLMITYELIRRLNYYMIRYYLLTFLAIMVSFVCFWIPVNMWPVRFALTVVPLLNLISQDIAINNEIKVGYTTLFHWWMMCLHLIIYFEIVEYALALSWAHFIMDKKNFTTSQQQVDLCFVLRSYLKLISHFYHSISSHRQWILIILEQC